MVDKLKAAKKKFSSRRVARAFGVGLVAVGLMLSSLVFLKAPASYASGCVNSGGKVYMAIGDCIAAASWDGESVKYGTDTFIARGGNDTTNKVAQEALGVTAVDLYRHNGTGHYIAMPSNFNPGETVDRAVFILIKSTGIPGGEEYNTKDIKIYKSVDDIPEEETKNADGVDVVSTAESNIPVCSIGDGLGWLICPAATFSAKLIDGSFAILANLMTYESLADPRASQALQAQWGVIRNIANLCFVIIFLIVIYSTIVGQGIGFGVSNYNLKRMIPRLVVAAILVNLSYWICAIAVDISNILGNNISGLLENARAVAVNSDPTSQESLGNGGTAEWVAVVGTALAVTGGVVAGGFTLSIVSMLIPVLFASLLAVVTVLLILAGRQALITLMIIIAPLAFVAFVLPNTNQWFMRWRKTFATLLFIFPVIALVFSASQLAATIIRISGEGTFEDGMLDLLSLAIQALPLYVVPIMLKSAGGIMNRIGAFTNDKSKGILDRGSQLAQRKVGNARKIQTANALKKVNDIRERGLKTRSDRAKLKMAEWRGLNVVGVNSQLRDREADSLLNYNTAQYHNDSLVNDDTYLRRMSGGNQEMAAILRGNAASAQNKQAKAVVDGLEVSFSNQSINQLRDAIKSGQGTDFELAAKSRVLAMKDQSLETLNALSELANTRRSGVIRNEIASANWDGFVGAGQADEIRNTSSNVDLAGYFATNAKLASQEQIARAGNGTLGALHQIAQNDAALSGAMQKTATELLNNDRLSPSIGKTRQNIENFSSRNHSP